MSKFVQKFSRQIIASVLLFSLILPNVAQAQLVTTDPILTGQVVMEYIGKLLKVVVKNVVVVGAVQVSQKIAKDAAESVATWVWEGAPGKNPLTYMESPGDYMKKQSEAALSDVLDQMSEDVANANLLCVSDPTAALGVLGGIYAALKDKANVKPFGNQPGSSQFSPTPELNLGKCDAGSIALNYQNLTNELSSDELLKRFSNAATSGGSEVDQVVSAQMNALTALVREQKSAEMERLAVKSYRDQTSLISGEVVQSSEAVAEDAKTNTAKFQQEQESRQLAGILASGAEAIPSIFATTFANAISKKIIDKLKRGKGTNPIPSVNLANIFGAGSKNISNSSAGSLYSDTKTAIISEGELDLLSSFAACPDKFNGVDNCVIDEGFASAIRAADAGKALTVQEAIDQGRLHANFEMVPPAKQALNESRLCAKSAYCFSNLAKLRKARVIPIGWEIAAASADGTGKTTLGTVVAGFNTCTYTCSNDTSKVCKADSECGTGTCSVPTRTKETPFCHLIDPNWVLKMPEQICRAKVYGPQLQSDLGADRQEVCSDQASCLAENSAGQCIGAYGYCLREKNTFRFEADECPAQFAGCRTYGNKVFGNISLLDATIDSGSCTDKNTGCMGYYADFAPTGLFDTNSTKVYLNDKAASCNIENIGCTEVQNAVTGKQQFLRLPPAGLGCKGYSNDPSACKQYAAACTVDEVGCEVYQPVGSTDPAVPGVITAATKDTSGNVVAWNDECAAECVGYSSYYQAPTPIEPVAAVATAFIPKSATMCTQDVVGCDAYLNIDTAAKGAGTTAYFAQPQKCSDPENNKNHSIYYSWEGSDQSGYQLRQHDLVMEADGKTPLLDVPQEQLAAVAAECTAAKYIARVTADGKPDPLFNTDCRELFDKNGAPFYRLISKTLPSTPNCVAYRKDKSDEANCAASNGKFDKETGSCEYGFLPSASTQCKPTEVGCRAYAGAAALSPKTVLNDSFTAIEGWSNAESSNEGITVGDTVLKFTGSNTAHTVSLAQNKTYNVVFWAKGQGSVNVSFVSGGTSLPVNAKPIGVSLEWRRFEVSSAPVPFTDESAKIVFEKAAGSAIYLENLVVKEQLDVVYAIKDSWSTPLSCDAIPGDNIPGPALNCRVYKPKSQTNTPQVYLTGFTGLCREKSAGCQKFVSTQNTAQITEKKVTFGDAERIIPADDFVYVIADSKASCPADKKGCSALGMKVGDKIETVAKINNPDDYANSSCQKKDEWCQTFTMPGGTQRYFKYPEAEKQCEYKEGVEVAGTKYTGWFKKGTTKPCYDDFVSGGNQYGIYKNQDKNFTGMSGLCQPEFNQCTEFIDHADVSRENPVGQPYYFMNNNRLDTSSCGGKVSLKEGCVLLENTDAIANTTYSTLATYCKSDAANDPQCAGILKKANIAAADQGKDGVSVAPVVGLKNEFYSLCKKAAISGVLVATDCESQVAKFKSIGVNTSGLSCADAAGVKNVQANVDEYKRTCAVVPDSNTIVKVRRDRTCAEWLSCQSSISVYDKTSQKFKEVCTDLGVCNKLSSDSGAVGQCANWVTPQQYSAEERLQRALPLTTARYVSRNVGWYGNEFSGYSLWKKFQPDTVGWFSKSQLQAESGNMLVGVGFTPDDALCAKSDGLNNGKTCTAEIFKDATNAALIKKEFPDANLEGICYEQKCWYPIEGFAAAKATASQEFIESSCRGYPEADSPFPASVGLNPNIFGIPSDFEQGYDKSNICELNRFSHLQYENGTNWLTFDQYKNAKGVAPYVIPNASCDCSYKKVVFGQLNEPKYYSLDETVVKAQKGADVLVRRNANIAGNFAWYSAKILQSADSTFTVEYVDKNVGNESGIPAAYLAYPTTDYSSLKSGDAVVALCPAAGGWYEGKVLSVGTNIQVQFGADVVAKTKMTKDTCTISKAPNNIAIKATQKEDADVEVPAGVCDGGWFVLGSKTAPKPQAVSKKGMSCSTDYDCFDERIVTTKNLVTGKAGDNLPMIKDQFSNEDGKCQFKTKETKVFGWKGYCLEKDLSSHLNGQVDDRACLTWLPIDIGSMDIYNQYTSAAFKVSPDGEGRYYCMENRGRLTTSSENKPTYTYLARGGGFADRVDYVNDIEYLGINQKDPKYDIKQYKSPGYTNGSSLDYGKAGLPSNLKAPEIDYIEVVATEGNMFFPKGYTMKIQDDGIVRLYNYEKTVDYYRTKSPNDYEKMACPAWKINNSMWGSFTGYDYLDPNTDGQLNRMSILSQQVRCGIGGLQPGTCDYYNESTKNVQNYFRCGGSEVDVSYPEAVQGDKVPMAITGVARTGKINGINYVPQIAESGPGIKQVWFLRIDNQKYELYNDSFNKGVEGQRFNEFGQDNFKLASILNRMKIDDPGTTETKVFSEVHKGILGCEGDSNDKKYAEQIGYELRLAFNEKGDFVWMDAGSCTMRDNQIFNVGWNVKVHLRDACTYIAKTDIDGENKAFTHRLWSAPNSGFSKFEEPDSNIKNDSIVVVSSTGAQVSSKQKFGSLAITVDPKDNPLIFTHILQKDNGGPNFGPALSGGEDSKGYSCDSGSGCLTKADGTVAPKVSYNDGRSAIFKLFAEVYEVYDTSITYDTKYKEADKGSISWDISGTEAAKEDAPVIFALDPTTCSGSRGGTCRMTKKYGMTINGVFGDNETVFGKNSIVANVQFYGSADMNHLPIKRVKINWDDASQELKKSGVYRNHKPICSTQSKPAAVCKMGGALDFNHTCHTDQDCVNTAGAVVGTCEENNLQWSFGSWGGTGSADEGACESGFFQFSHAYAFTPDCGGSGKKPIVATASDIEQYKLQGKVAIGERFCVFKPRVQLLDNWDVCNGATGGQGGKKDTILNCDLALNEYYTEFQGNIIVKE